MDGTVTVLVGTTKGAFLIDGGTDRTGWHVRGPFCKGWPINHVVGDAESGTIWAGGGSEWNGAGIWRSGDLRIKAKAGKSRASPEVPLMIGPRRIPILRQ